MKKEKMIFDDKQQKLVYCASGRVMVCLNEQEVTTIEQVLANSDDKDEQKYDNREKTQFEYDVYWLDGIKARTEEAVFEAAIMMVVADIEKYDSSPAVNGFKLNGVSVWLDKATRVGLMNSTTIAKATGIEKTTLWLGGQKIDMNCDKIIQMLSALEMYALECFNMTAEHKKAVSEMDSIENVLTYDYTTGYPEYLDFNI